MSPSNGSSSRGSDSNIPAIRPFQIDPQGFGALTDGVNLFRGEVSLPLTLASLAGRGGLRAEATIVCTTSVGKQTETWNLAAPTGPAGLGWSLGYEFIALDVTTSAVGTEDQYFLVAGGSTNRLHQTSDDGDSIAFELESYQFWDIHYFPRDERWVIVKEDGQRWIYGGGAGDDPAVSALQYGVKWRHADGNWSDGSTQPLDQAGYVTAWNLSRVETLWGDSLQFVYENDVLVVGGDTGLRYTRASRISKTLDPTGQSIDFHYEPKQYDATVREYELPHIDPHAPSYIAWQDHLDTSYLAKIEVRGAGEGNDRPLLQWMTFEYALVNCSSQPSNPDLYKRYLTAIRMRTGDGLALPGMMFGYYNRPEDRDAGRANGALREVTYPQGGTVRYGYEATTLTGTSCDLELTPRGTPRVFFGPDYSVVTHIDIGARGLTAEIYSWNGTWISAARTYEFGIEIDLDTLQVSGDAEFFSLSFHTREAGSRLFVALFRRNPARFGDWTMADGFTALPIGPGGDQGLVATGTDFAVAITSGGGVMAKVWDPPSRSWLDRSTSIVVPPNAQYALAAMGRYFVLAAWSTGTVHLSLWYVDFVSRDFEQGSLQNDRIDDVDWKDSTPDTFFSPGADHTGITYLVQGTDSSKVGLVALQWDDHFRGSFTLREELTAERLDELPFLQTTANGSMLGNVTSLFRYDGIDWTRGSLGDAGNLTKDARFIFGNDTGIVQDGSRTSVQIYDAFKQSWQAASTGAPPPAGAPDPTIAGTFFTLGSSVYFRRNTGEVTQIATLDPNMNPKSLANRAPLFIAYEDGASNTHVLPLRNGEVRTDLETVLPNEKIVSNVDGPGTSLVGSTMVVTYTGPSLDDAATLTLRQYVNEGLDGPMVVRPVTSIVIDDGYPNLWGPAREKLVLYRYDCANVTVAPPDATVTEFAAATAIYGAEAVGGSGCYPPPDLTPWGSSEFRFHNNRTPRENGFVLTDAAGGPAATDDYTLLVGLIYDRTDRDSEGVAVARQVSHYEVRRERELLDGSGTLVPLYGAYVKLLSVDDAFYENVLAPPEATLDEAVPSIFSAYGIDTSGGVLVERVPGRVWTLFPDPDSHVFYPVVRREDGLAASIAVLRRSVNEFSYATGLTTVQSMETTSSLGERVTMRTLQYYAWQVPEYAAMRDLHLLTQQAAMIKMTDPANGDDVLSGSPTEMSLTTWREWSGDRWAVARTFAAATDAVFDPAATPPVRFEGWSNDEIPPETEWRMTSAVTQRLDAGPVLEALDASLRPTATIFDASATFMVANATNAAASEFAYAGFEPYEMRSPWSAAGDATVVRGDAHTGSCSLSLVRGGSLEAVRTLVDPARPWLVTVWIRSAAPLGATDAAIVILSGSVEIQRFPIDGTSGAWEYRSYPFVLSGDGPLQITMRIANSSTTALLLDDLFFAPLHSAAAASVYHDTHLDLAATVGSNKVTTRSLLDSRRRPAIDIGAVGSVTNAAMVYSTQLFHEVPAGEPFVYPQGDPDSTLQLVPTEASPFADFVQGDRWESEWNADAGAWIVEDGALLHVRSTEDAIRWNVTDGMADYAARVSVLLPVDADGLPVLPAYPLGMAIGTRVRATWQRKGQWSIELDGESISVSTGTSEFQNDWLIAVPTDPVTGTTDVLVFADGRLLFSRTTPTPVSGALELFARDSGIGFHGIAAIRSPRIGMSFTDGSGKQRQRNVCTGGGDYVSGTVFDPIGRAAIPLKTILSENDRYVYITDLVTSFDEATGVIEGRVADFYPEDQGYPYARTDYYRSPLGMSRAQSLAGKEFAITGSGDDHVRRFIYGTNAPPFWDSKWPAGEYFVQQTIDPDGGCSFTLRTKTDQVVAVQSGPLPDGSYQKAVTEYDAAERPVRQYLPNHFRAGASADSFVIHTTYNYLGEITRTADPDGGVVRRVADRSGQLRFTMRNDGSDSGTIVYIKYDALARTIEEGFFEGTWDEAFLSAKALEDPAYPGPEQPHTVTSTREYDGDGSDPTEVGRLIRVTTHDGSNVVETYAYNLAGAIVRVEQLASAYDSTPRAMTYSYNVAGDTISVTFPSGSAVTEVRQSYDRAGNLTNVGVPGAQDEFGAYSYTATGLIKRETFDPRSVKPITRDYTYNPPGWPLSVRTTLPDASLLLSETLTYTTGGYNGAGYYSGQAASIAFDGSATTNYAYRNQYDALRRLETSENTADPDASVGVPEPVTYDPNGNFTRYVEGDEIRDFTYEPETDRVQRVDAGEEPLDSYTYTDAGSVESAQRLQLENFTYGAVDGLPRTITTGDGRSVAFAYGDHQRRVVKKELGSGGEELSAKLYVRGTSLLPHAESSRGANARDTQYIYGPSGLQALLTGGRRYTVIRDRIGSVRAVVDESRNVVASFEYYPFGTIIRRGGTAPDMIFYRFTGQELDPETGLYNFNARMYDAWLGRFYAVDPAGAGFSPYAYVENDPFNLVDPTGEEPLTAFLILLVIGIVVGAVAGMITYAATYQGEFDGLKFVLYGVVGAVAGGIGAAAGFVAGQLAVTALAAAGVATSTSIASGVVVGAATAAAEGAVSSTLNQIGVNLVERRNWDEGLGMAAGLGAGIGALTGGVFGGVTGALNRRVAMRLAGGQIGASATNNGTLYNNTWLRAANGGVFDNRGNNFAVAIQNTGANDVLSLAGHGARNSTDFFDDLGGVAISTANVVGSAPVGGFGGYGVNLTAVCYAGRNGIARQIASAWNVPVRAANSRTWTRAGGALTGWTRARSPNIIDHLLLRSGRMETIYPSRIKTGWVSIFGY